MRRQTLFTTCTKRFSEFRRCRGCAARRLTRWLVAVSRQTPDLSPPRCKACDCQTTSGLVAVAGFHIFAEAAFSCSILPDLRLPIRHAARKHLWPVLRSLQQYQPLLRFTRPRCRIDAGCHRDSRNNWPPPELGGFSPQIGFFRVSGGIAGVCDLRQQSLSFFSGSDSTITPIFAGSLAAVGYRQARLIMSRSPACWR